MLHAFDYDRKRNPQQVNFEIGRTVERPLTITFRGFKSKANATYLNAR
jgi:hypothetical protein